VLPSACRDGARYECPHARLDPLRLVVECDRATISCRFPQMLQDGDTRKTGASQRQTRGIRLKSAVFDG
jgi:hypothetical protein